MLRATAPRPSRPSSLSAPAACLALLLASGPALAEEAPAEKAAEDPTKIATKLGISYSDEFAVSGSLAFGPVTKANVRVTKSGQWQLGGSYLFPIGILNFSAGKNELNNGAEQTRYSLGSFVPFSALKIPTGKWQVFATFGYSHTTGSIPVDDFLLDETMTITLSNDSIYMGLFSIRPLSRRLTLLGGAIATRGTDDFSGLSAGAGLSWHLTETDTLAGFASYIDNSYGSDQKLHVSYRHEF